MQRYEYNYLGTAMSQASHQYDLDYFGDDHVTQAYTECINILDQFWFSSTDEQLERDLDIDDGC